MQYLLYLYYTIFIETNKYNLYLFVSLQSMDYNEDITILFLIIIISCSLVAKSVVAVISEAPAVRGAAIVVAAIVPISSKANKRFLFIHVPPFLVRFDSFIIGGEREKIHG